VTEQMAASVDRLPRIYLNGFPKSGLHLAVLMARSITTEAALHPAWSGCFTDNSWSLDWAPIVSVMAGLRCLRDDTWLKGHMGYLPVYEQYLYWHGAAMVFIYRDPRDVLVSQAYHVASEDDTKFFHPDKAIYKAMDHEARLLACLEGVGKYAGLFDRWELYAPWLGVPWVLKMRFEGMIHDREATVRGFVRYVWQRTVWGLEQAQQPTEMEDSMVELICKNMDYRPDGGTFRKGTTGQWRDEFTPRVKDAFKARAGNWLVRLGYEEDNDW
jgi:hypothetical protein